MHAIKGKIRDQEYTLACEHWKTWPPVAVAIGLTAQEMRDRGMIDDVERQRIEVWEKRCGLKMMNVGKCETCPHLRKVTADHTGLFLTTLDNKKSSRISDPIAQKNFRETLKAVYRRPGTPGSNSNAAWIEAERHGRE